MKRKFVKVMFFGALALSTVTYVGCKDYDDDVKGLQEQIDNINQKGADVTTEAMNAAISSAIAKVQADLDKIASKADKSALDALQAVVTKLQEAVNGKADASTLESLKAELNEAIATVDSSIQPKIDAAKTQLEGQIAALETKLEEADEAIKGSIATQIADLKTELQDLMDANAAEYAKLYATKVDLNALSDRVETLEKIKHLTTDDVLSFIQTDADVKKYIDDEFVALLQQNLDKPESALRAYLEGVFTTDIMTQVEAKCGEIADTKMEALRQEWTTYKAEQGEDYKAIVERLATLEGYNLSTMEELYNSLTDPKNNTIDKANTCFEALGDITDLATEFGKYTTTTKLEKNYVQIADLNTKIGEYIGNSISDLDSKVATLETKLNALQSGLTSMLKSLVFAPQKYDASGELVRSVSFASIYTSTAQTAEGPVVISAPTSVKVNFRVSPAADLIGEHPKYTITTDKHVITSRAATNDGILTVASVEQAKDEADVAIEGMITVTLNAATAVKSYALSLSVVGNNEEGKDVTNFTEINSDYFAVIVSKKYINAVDYAAKTYGSPELLVDKAGSAINFYDAEKNSEYIKVKLSDNENGSSPAAEAVTLASLGLSPDLFEVTFEKTEVPADADYFVLNPTTYALTVNQSKLPASSRYNKTCTVTPKIKVTTTATNEGQPVKVDYTGTVVNAKIVAEGVNLEYAVADLYWKDAVQTANLKSEEIGKILAKINEVAGASYESFSAAVSGATKSTAADGGVTIDASGDDVVVTIPAKTVGDEAKDYTFKPALTLTYANSAIVNITVDVKVLAPVVTDLKLGANTINWDGKSVVDLMPSADAQAMTALTVSRKLSEVLLATDIAALKKAVQTDKTVQLKITKGGDESETNLYPGTINFDDFTVKAAAATDKAVSYTFSLYYTPKDQDPVVLNANLLTVNLKPSVKVAGTITAPEEEARTITKTKLTDTYDLSTDFTWKEFRGVTIWPTFAAASGGATTDPATVDGALAIYSGSVKYIVSEESRATFVNCFNTTGYTAETGEIAAANKTIQLNDVIRAQEGAIVNPITVKIKVIATTAWGAPENAETELTITYPEGSTK